MVRDNRKSPKTRRIEVEIDSANGTTVRKDVKLRPGESKCQYDEDKYADMPKIFPDEEEFEGMPPLMSYDDLTKQPTDVVAEPEIDKDDIVHEPEAEIEKEPEEPEEQIVKTIKIQKARKDDAPAGENNIQKIRKCSWTPVQT